jgi:hypothetical protein
MLRALAGMQARVIKQSSHTEICGFVLIRVDRRWQ